MTIALSFEAIWQTSSTSVLAQKPIEMRRPRIWRTFFILIEGCFTARCSCGERSIFSIAANLVGCVLRVAASILRSSSHHMHKPRVAASLLRTSSHHVHQLRVSASLFRTFSHHVHRSRRRFTAIIILGYLYMCKFLFDLFLTTSKILLFLILPNHYGQN